MRATCSYLVDFNGITISCWPYTQKSSAENNVLKGKINQWQKLQICGIMTMKKTAGVYRNAEWKTRLRQETVLNNRDIHS